MVKQVQHSVFWGSLLLRNKTIVLSEKKTYFCNIITIIMAKEKTNEFNPNKLYYSISEVASYLDIAESNIRFWEKEFEAFIKPQRTAKGNRQFTMKDIEVLKQIKYLVKDCGMTLDGASKRLSKNRTDVETNMEIVSRLEGIKEMLVGIKNEM